MTNKYTTTISTKTETGARTVLSIHMMLQSLIAIVVLATPFSSFAGWDDYTEKTLQSTIDENIDLVGNADLTLTPGLPQRVLVTYIGNKRSIPEERERLVQGWLKSIGQSAEYGGLFLTEMRFTENGITHWLPVQTHLITHLEKEMRTGDKVWLYAVWIGTTKTEWVFIVNEFQNDIAQEAY